MLSARRIHRFVWAVRCTYCAGWFNLRATRRCPWCRVVRKH